MKSKLKLKNRILLGYAIPISIYLGFAGLVYSSVTQIVQVFAEVNRVEKVVTQSSEIALSAEGMIRSSRGFLINSNPKFIEEYKAEKQLLLNAIVTTEQLIVRSDQKQRIQKMSELAMKFDRYATTVIALKQQNQVAKAQAIFSTGIGNTIIHEFDKLYHEFADTEKKLLAQKVQQAHDNLNSVLLALIIGSLLIVLFSLIVAWIISFSITRMIDQSVTGISSSSLAIAVTAEQHEKTAQQQSVAVTQTTVSMDELNASSRKSAEQAEIAAKRAQQVLLLVDDHQTNGQAVSTSSLREKVDQIADKILLLSEQTNQIGTITALVSGIANQTNLLALNASVEAVRAGEHGKGFGVVAAEIRKLAHQTRVSAERINDLITTIQTATNSTVMATSEGTRTVEMVVTEINDIAMNNQQILLTAKQQATAIEQVVSAMNAINQGVAETASGITQTKVGTQKLNEAALRLKSMI